MDGFNTDAVMIQQRSAQRTAINLPKGRSKWLSLLERRDWARYNAAQENEFPEVIGLIGTFVGKASEAFRPPPRYDAMGREPYSTRDVARLVLAQQYDGRCNRVSIGLLTMFKPQLGKWLPTRLQGSVQCKPLRHFWP
jgi:hypothetical protein